MRLGGDNDKLVGHCRSILEKLLRLTLLQISLVLFWLGV